MSLVILAVTCSCFRIIIVFLRDEVADFMLNPQPGGLGDYNFCLWTLIFDLPGGASPACIALWDIETHKPRPRQGTSLNGVEL